VLSVIFSLTLAAGKVEIIAAPRPYSPIPSDYICSLLVSSTIVANAEEVETTWPKVARCASVAILIVSLSALTPSSVGSGMGS
jgi:hypothetical protein